MCGLGLNRFNNDITNCDEQCDTNSRLYRCSINAVACVEDLNWMTIMYVSCMLYDYCIYIYVHNMYAFSMYVRRFIGSNV